MKEAAECRHFGGENLLRNLSEPYICTYTRIDNKEVNRVHIAHVSRQRYLLGHDGHNDL